MFARSHRSSAPRQIDLLPREALVKTNPVDEADWNFRPLLGVIQRQRFRLAVQLLRPARYQRLLEIGYGSGVFLTELRRHCNELYGIDPHPMPDRVADVLARRGVTVQLCSGGAASMPFADSFFDCAVAVSAVEFIDHLETACIEIRRILAPGGVFIVVTPGSSPIMDLGLRILTGNDPQEDFGNRRQAVVPTLLRHFVLQRTLTFPPFGGSLARLYTALRLSNKK